MSLLPSPAPIPSSTGRCPGCQFRPNFAPDRLAAQRRLRWRTLRPRAKLSADGDAADDGDAGDDRGAGWERADHEREAERLFRSAQQQEGQRIGAEYGEGFVQFRMSGATHLDVEALNRRLKSNGAMRMRHAMRPDEQYGMVFMFDSVIANTRQLQRRAWQQLADEEGLPFPAEPRHLYDMRAERVITEVLHWTRDWGRAQELAWRVAVLYAEQFEQLRDATLGVAQWLAALRKANTPCALVSHMPAAHVKAALERMDLEKYFSARVTAEDDMDTLAERLLSASLKLQRPPNHCVVFVASPGAVTAAHNCTMKAVAVQGAHKGWELKQADLTVAGLDELTVYNLRRLFAQRGEEFMDLKTAQVGKKPPKARTVSGTM